MGHVASKGEIQNANEILFVKPEEIQVYAGQEILCKCECMFWINLAQGTDNWRVKRESRSNSSVSIKRKTKVRKGEFVGDGYLPA